MECDIMRELLNRYPKLSVCEDSITKALELMIETYKNGGKVLICGNGGSASDSGHIVGELMKGFLLPRKVTDERISPDLREHLQGGLPAISLCSHEALMMAFINDVKPDMVYAQQVYGYAKKEDLVIGITTSGNSANVVNAIRVAKDMGVKTIGLTGEKGGKLAEIADVTVKVPETETYKVQEYHLPVYHYLCAKTEEAFFG